MALVGWACGGATRGTLTAFPPEPPTSSPTLTTSDAPGLRVLWNGSTTGRVGPQDPDEGWAAGNQAQFEDLWKAAGVRLPAPRVDFTSEVVFGVSGPGGVCPSEIIGMRLEPGGVLRLMHAPPDGVACVDVLTRVAVIVAVPRTAVGSTVTLAPTPSHRGMQFAVPPAADAGARAAESGAPNAPSAVGLGTSQAEHGAAGTSAESGPQRAIGDAGTSAEAGPQRAIGDAEPSIGGDSQRALGEVTVPERGHLVLVRVADGSEVWVVHHRDGRIDVLCSTVAARDTNYYDLRTPLAHALRVAPAWDPRRGRFHGGYDAHGRNVHGWPPLCRHRFTRVGPDRIRIEGAIANDTGPIQPATAAPVLDGPAAPYRDRPVVEQFDRIPPGHVEVLAADVVWGRSGPARLCRAPVSEPARSQFTGCAEEAPRVASSDSGTRSVVVISKGPVVVRRLGAALAEVVLIGRSDVDAIALEP